MVANNRIPPHIVVAESVVNILYAWMSPQLTTLSACIWNEKFNVFMGCELDLSNAGIVETDWFNTLEDSEVKSLHHSVNQIRLML